MEITDQYLASDETESYIMTCRPSESPQNSDESITHFFSRESSSTFKIACGNNFLRVGIYGRSELKNPSNKGLLNKIRSVLITFFAGLKITKIEWKCIADGLLDFDGV